VRARRTAEVNPATAILIETTSEVVSNVAWGDKGGKTLYITGSTSIYRIKLNLAGDRAH
jgi:hypothetical protein